MYLAIAIKQKERLAHDASLGVRRRSESWVVRLFERSRLFVEYAFIAVKLA